MNKKNNEKVEVKKIKWKELNNKSLFIYIYWKLHVMWCDVCMDKSRDMNVYMD